MLIDNNDTLETLGGLTNLKSIGGSLIVKNNFMLKSIDGIKKLKKVEGEFINICFNENLKSIPNFIKKLAENRDNINNVQKPKNFCEFRPTYRKFLRPLNREIFR